MTYSDLCRLDQNELTDSQAEAVTRMAAAEVMGYSLNPLYCNYPVLVMDGVQFREYRPLTSYDDSVKLWQKVGCRENGLTEYDYNPLGDVGLNDSPAQITLAALKAWALMEEGK